jgi:hypothetical protein
MSGIKRLGRVLAIVASLGVCLPQLTWAADQAAPAVVDVTLRDGGLLLGKVINPDGAAQTQVPIAIRFDGRELVTTTTDQQGYFAVKGLQGGVHQVVTTNGQGVYQLWIAGTAPPGAKEGALVITSTPVVRGQVPDNAEPPRNPGLKTFLTNPLVIGAIVVTAVAVPIAVTQANRSP